ncbi:MAG: hypothetical protein FJ033_10835 [Chloroflexi bacterium]|nr:hypothetical protein [Chloroflexota bacterium]
MTERPTEPPASESPGSSIAHVIVGVGAALYRRPIIVLGAIAVIVVLIGAVVWIRPVAISPGGSIVATPDITPLPTSIVGSATNEEAPFADQYLASMSRFDAVGMVETYDPNVRRALEAAGMTSASVQSDLDKARSRGAAILSVSRIASYLMADGRRYVFYVVARSGFRPDGASDEIFYVFTLAPTGRLMAIS